MHVSRWFVFVLVSLLIWSACGDPRKPKGEACSQDSQCLEGLKCFAEQCSDGKEGASCGKGSDCASGLQCVNKVCRKGDAEPGGEPVAEAGPEPTAEAGAEPRPEPQSPDASEPIVEKAQEKAPDSAAEKPTEKVLGQNCRSHNECTPGQMCLISKDRLTAQCGPVPTACKSNADCKTSGTYCRLLGLRDGSVATHCTFPYDNGTPLKKPGEICKSDSECQSGVCLNETVCGAYCKEDKDCPAQFYCGSYTRFQNGEFGGCYPKCKGDNDCPDGYTCDSASKCVPKDPGKVGSACRAKSECPAGGECLNTWTHGYCLTPCTPTKIKCDPTMDPPGKCKDANHRCMTNVDDNSEMICVPKCSTGNVCALFGGGLGFCLLTCKADSDCRKDYYCAAINDGQDMACLPRGKAKLGETCETNGSCESGRCRLFPSGRYCTQTCSATSTCPTGYSCNTYDTLQLCEKDCIKSSDCPEGYQCLAQRCTIPAASTNLGVGEACTADSQCKGNKCLNNSGLQPHGYCTQACGGQSQPCPTGSLCINYGGALGSLCTKNCKADADCKRKDYFCFHVRLNNQGAQIPCSNSTPCQAGTAFPITCTAAMDGSFCTTGICLGRGTRSSGQQCTTAFQCRSGYCYLRYRPPSLACLADADCASQPSTPKCHPTAKRCVECATSADCGTGLSCIGGFCTNGGYCADDCAAGGKCPQGSNTHCTAVFNSKTDKVGDYCLPECRSSLQCQGDFNCKQQQGNNVCYAR